MKKMIAVLAVGGLLAASIPQIPVAAAEIPAKTFEMALSESAGKAALHALRQCFHSGGLPKVRAI